jgi:hypothetical protein
VVLTKACSYAVLDVLGREVISTREVQVLGVSAVVLTPSLLFCFCPWVPVVPPVPEWAQQELGHTIPWNSAIVEKWFPFSNISGASSNLMESFW